MAEVSRSEGLLGDGTRAAGSARVEFSAEPEASDPNATDGPRSGLLEVTDFDCAL